MLRSVAFWLFCAIVACGPQAGGQSGSDECASSWCFCPGVQASAAFTATVLSVDPDATVHVRIEAIEGGSPAVQGDAVDAVDVGSGSALPPGQLVLGFVSTAGPEFLLVSDVASDGAVVCRQDTSFQISASEAMQALLSDDCPQHLRDLGLELDSVGCMDESNCAASPAPSRASWAAWILAVAALLAARRRAVRP